MEFFLILACTILLKRIFFVNQVYEDWFDNKTHCRVFKAIENLVKSILWKWRMNCVTQTITTRAAIWTVAIL